MTSPTILTAAAEPVVTLEDERFTHLYLTVDDPAGLAAQINAAIRPAQA